MYFWMDGDAVLLVRADFECMCYAGNARNRNLQRAATRINMHFSRCEPRCGCIAMREWHRQANICEDNLLSSCWV